jgi:hypothetical protein
MQLTHRKKGLVEGFICLNLTLIFVHKLLCKAVKIMNTRAGIVKIMAEFQCTQAFAAVKET